jgi:hypothetical protein
MPLICVEVEPESGCLDGCFKFGVIAHSGQFAADTTEKQPTMKGGLRRRTAPSANRLGRIGRGTLGRASGALARFGEGLQIAT